MISGREYNPDDWDGRDYLEEMDPDLQVPGRTGQGAQEDSDAQQPNYTPDNRTYASNWSSIAKTAKERANFRCQRCGIDLIDRLDLLHVHHLDSNKNNNEDWNIMPLCVLCHADRQNHRHLIERISNMDREILEKRREMRGMS